MENVADLHDDILLARIDQALGNERQLLVRLLAYLGEVEARRLELRSGYSSMFDFCTDRLRLSEGEAFRRLLGARLARQFPVIYELLESGALHLTALELLRHYLTPDNHAELLEAARFKKKAEIQELIACRFPKPDEPSTIRKVPERRAAETEAPEQSNVTTTLQLESPPRTASSSRTESELAPLSAGRYRVRFTAGQELKDKLERALGLMSHANPSFDLAVVVERAVDLLLDKLERTKLGKADHPRKSRGAKHGAITRAARREVTERDGERCAWVDEKTGRRCKATRFLELDHVQAKARGGSGEPTNIRKLCHRHNRLHAEETFGRDYVESAIHFRQQKRRGPDASPLTETEAKVLKALTTMGFRVTEARAALERVRADGRAAEASLESLLRGALGVLADGHAPSG